MLLLLLTVCLEPWSRNDLNLYEPLLTSNVVATEDHNLFIMIFNEMKILKINQSGELEKTFGGMGQGPGEFAFLDRIIWDHNQHRLYAVDLRRNNLTVFSKDGDFITSFQIPYAATSKRSHLHKVKGGWVFADSKQGALLKASEQFETITPVVGSWDPHFTYFSPRYNPAEDRILFEGKGQFILYYLPGKDTIHTLNLDSGATTSFSTGEKAAPFDEDWGEEKFKEHAKRARKRWDAVPDYPENFPLFTRLAVLPTGEIRLTPGRTLISNQKNDLFYDMNGARVETMFPIEAYLRIIGIVGDWAYIKEADEEERITLSRISLKDLQKQYKLQN